MARIKYASCTSVDTSSIDTGYSYIDSEVADQRDVEFTLAIIKPEAVQYSTIIEKIIKNEGFKVIKKRKLHLTAEQASDFYIEHYGKTTYPKMTLALSDGPIIVYCLSKVNAVKDWKTLLGPPSVSDAKKLFPTSLRAYFGRLADDRNGLHGSDSSASAETEIHFFFPPIINVPFRTEQQRIDYLNETIIPLLLRGLVELCKRKPADPLIWLGDWLLENNPNTPNMPSDLLQIPT